MNKKRITIISLIVVLILSITGITYYFLNKPDKNTTLTILEKKWIENNKNNVIDLSIINNIPVFNYEGNGVLFDFIENIEKDTNLEFNKLSYEIGTEPNSEYSFKIVDKIDKNQLKIYEDNYAIITKQPMKYNSLEEIPTITVGVLSGEIDKINYYLGANKNIIYKPYKNTTQMITEIKSDKSTIDGIILPKTIYLKNIIESDKLNISYNITEMKKYLVLNLGNEKRLNQILKKYYEKWSNESYETSFNENFSSDYFKFKQIYEQEQVNFKSKRYAYAFIDYAPYDSLVDRKLVGINNEIIKNFASSNDIEISFKKYKNINELVNAFNENKVDFFFNTSNRSSYELDIDETLSVYQENIAVISKDNKNITINSLASLNNYNVLTIKDSKIEEVLKENDIDARTYNNIGELINKKKDEDVIVIDYLTYGTYMYDQLKDYKIDYQFQLLGDYNFICKDINDNKVFNEFFNFYLSFINENEFINRVNYKLFKEQITNHLSFIIILLLFIILIIITTVFIIKKLKPKKKETISREDKLRYIDMLTSLKNRNYLNDSIEAWDNSEIYPQTLIIVDLNNIAYINDNYGHEEGDNIIKEAAGILIKTQIENSEIMRTNGNEFLIYLVSYDEKQIVTYIRKLNKELKELNHGFGAAIGYSMINDPIKTIDDAINEATLDMKSNKEELQG